MTPTTEPESFPQEVPMYFENWLNGSYCHAQVRASRTVTFAGGQSEVEFLALLEQETEAEWLPAISLSRNLQSPDLTHNPEQAKLG